MSTESLKRKLAAILYADVAGYSRLTGDDEDATHRRLREYLDLIAATIESHHGQVMHYAGDAVLAKFDAVVDALSSAVAIQEQLKNQNLDLPDERKVQFRIGVNSGDVIEDRGDIYGDGVNVAARLEGLADAGGICISESVRTAIGKKLDLGYESMGEQQVKNIEEPVRAYKVALDSEKKTQATSPTKSTLELPDKPSIAVLPFTNMSNDPEQEFFADGITEDIITELSREKDLFVIARNSTSAYKGQTPDIRQVAKELGVKYVLEGSMRKAGNKIRLNAQLIEGETNRHVWAERYDRALEDIFEVQDDLTNTIMNTLLQKIQDTSMDRALRRPPQNLAAFDHYTRGFGLLLRLNKKDNEEAMQEAYKALELDPDYARAHMLLSWAHLYSMWTRWVEDPGAALKQGHERALKAIACDKDDFWGYGALSFAELFMENHDRALTAIDRAVVLNPNSADTRAMRAIILNYTGNPEEGLKEVELAIRHNPNHPYWYLIGAGRALFLLERYDEALPYLERLINAGEDISSWRSLLAATYMGLGRQQEAREEITKAIEADLNLTITELLSLLPMKDAQAIERYSNLLRQAGLPD